MYSDAAYIDAARGNARFASTIPRFAFYRGLLPSQIGSHGDLEDMMRQTAIPCVFMRGGTSRGPYFLAADLPSDPSLRDRVLLAVMGSPDARQIDGLGRVCKG